MVAISKAFVSSVTVVILIYKMTLKRTLKAQRVDSEGCTKELFQKLNLPVK